MTGHAGGLDQALFAQVPEVRGPIMQRGIVVVAKLPSRHDSERTDSGQGARLGSAEWCIRDHDRERFLVPARAEGPPDVQSASRGWFRSRCGASLNHVLALDDRHCDRVERAPMNDLGDRRPIVDRSTLQPPAMRRDCPEFVPPAQQLSEEVLTETIERARGIESKSPTLRVVAGRSWRLDSGRDFSLLSWDKNGTIWRGFGLFRVVPKTKNPNKNGPNCPELSWRSEKKRLLTGGLLVRVQPEEPNSRREFGLLVLKSGSIANASASVHDQVGESSLRAVALAKAGPRTQSPDQGPATGYGRSGNFSSGE